MGTIRRQSGNAARPSWAGVETESYAEAGVEGATRRVLIGPNQGARNFSIRYFEIPPGGSSSLDQHAHDHGVYIVTGSARVLLGGDTYDVGVGDVVYIEPNEPHQFTETAGRILGFLCVVPPR